MATTLEICNSTTMPVAEPVRHTRHMPEEWAALTEQARHIIPQTEHNEPITNRQLRKLWKPVIEVPSDRREGNLYYGIGEIICEVARALHKEQARAEIVRRAAASMLASAMQIREVPKDKPFVPHLRDLITANFPQVFLPAAVQAQRKLPPWHRALTGALLVARNREQRTSLAGHIRYAATKYTTLPEVGKAFFAGIAIAINVVGGAEMAFMNIVNDKEPGSKLDSSDVDRPFTDADLALFRQRSADFSGAARLRGDELFNGLGWAEPAKGKLRHFNIPYLQTPPPKLTLVQGHVLSHTTRWACPALQAGGFAIEVARDLLPEIITTAQQTVPAEQFNVI